MFMFCVHISLQWLEMCCSVNFTVDLRSLCLFLTCHKVLKQADANWDAVGTSYSFDNELKK